MKLLVTFFICFSCQAIAQSNEFGWLVGTWQQVGKPAFEIWKHESGPLSAESYKMEGDKKIVTEEIKLIKKGSTFYYVPDVAGPQGAVEFVITSFHEKGFKAENTKHDFPTFIEYQLTDEKHFMALIGNGDKTISYSFVKIK